MYSEMATVHCKNNLCEKSAQISVINGKFPKPLPPCPNCGFKTLDRFSLSKVNREAILESINQLTPAKGDG